MANKKKKTDYKWFFTIIAWTFPLTITMSAISQGVLPKVNVIIAVFVLILIILLGITFDIIGISVASADLSPFHSMASRQVKGSKEAIFLINSADHVSNFCNDVIGDIAGIISGATSVLVATEIATTFNFNVLLSNLLLTGIVSSLTVGGKGLGKGFAMSNSTSIILNVGLIMYYVKRIFWRFSNESNRKNKSTRK